jgi:chromosome segregation ATPase
MRLGPRKLLAGAGVVAVALAGWLAYVTAGTPGLLGVVLAVVLATALAQGYLLVQLGRTVSATDRRTARLKERLDRTNAQLDRTNERLERSNERLRETAVALRREQKRAAERQVSLEGLTGRLEVLAADRDELREALLRVDASLDELAGRVERPSEQAEALLRAVNAGFRRLQLERRDDREGSVGD